jgi:hypothetical protein
LAGYSWILDESTALLFQQHSRSPEAADDADAVGSGPVALIAADLNADGIPDLAVVNQYDNTVSLLNGKGDGTFTAQSTMATGGVPLGIAFADFTGGGLNSVVVRF